MTTPIETDDLRALFDIALKTGDFVSGLLDREEIDLLRKLAVRLGVDPMEATPSKYAGSYPHAPKPRDWDPEDCEWDCRKPIDDPIHTAEWMYCPSGHGKLERPDAAVRVWVCPACDYGTTEVA